MITLLLTLFIFVFSYCPSINTIEDHFENTIIVNTPLTKSSYRDNGVTYINYTEMANPTFYYTIIDTMKASEIDPDFPALGGHIVINHPYGVYDVSYDSNNKTFTNNISINKIDLIYDRSLDDYWEFDIDINYYNEFATHIHFIIYYGDTETSFIQTWIEYSSYVSSPNYNHYLAWTFDSELINYFELPSTYENGYNQGYYEGFNNGKIVGYNNGKADGISSGYQTGYTDGYNEGFQIDPTAATIFNGVLEIGLLPVNFFLSIFNFEVFGINIKSIVSGLLTVAVIIIITRFLFGGKDNDK